ncbi:hypothetical protein AB6A23_03745 [Paenibacillus tarimensis]
MFKKALLQVMVLIVILFQLPVGASKMDESSGAYGQLQNAADQWNVQNTSYKVDLSNLSQTIKDYVRSLPSGVQIQLYKRQIPDQRKQFTRMGTSPIQLPEVPAWYSGGEVEDKGNQIVDRMRAAHNAPPFADGYKFTLNNSPLSLILLGGQANIDKANALIISKGIDESKYGFTNTEVYYLYFQFGHVLNNEAKQVLYNLIVEMARTSRLAFTPEKSEKDFLYNNNHNQTIEGFVRGVLYAQAANDNEMMQRMENNVLDRMIAYSALQGFGTGDYNSPSYAAFSWANLLTVHTLIENPVIKAKVELLLDKLGLDVAMRYHEPSASMPGPYARTFTRFNFGNVDRQSMFNIIYRSSDGYQFYQSHESNGYAWWYANLALMQPFFPDYMQEIAFRKQFPYSISNTKLRNATPEHYLIAPGNQGYTSPHTRYKIANATSYASKEYTVGSAPDTVWYGSGYGGQDGLILSHWRRTDQGIKSLSDIGTMFPLYRYNADVALDGGASMNKEIQKESWSFPIDQGLSSTVQYENKAIVLSYPGKAEDAKFAGVKPTEINDMGTAVFIGWPEEIKGVWADNDFIFGEIQLMTFGSEEVRAKITGANLPYDIKGNKKIFIEDFNTYIALQPLNTTDLGRDIDGQIRNFASDINKPASIPVESILSIHFYNYHGTEQKSVDQETRNKQRNGYIMEMGDRSEYKTIAEFMEHINRTSYKQIDEGDKWIASYKSGKDKLSIEFDTENLVVTKRIINGKVQLDQFYELDQDGPVYDSSSPSSYYSWMNKEPYTTTAEMLRSNDMVQSAEKHITVRDAKLTNPDGAMVYLVAEPNKHVYVIGNLTAKDADFTLNTPYGTLQISDLNLGRVIFRPMSEDEIEIKHVPFEGKAEPVVRLKKDGPKTVRKYN